MKFFVLLLAGFFSVSAHAILPAPVAVQKTGLGFATAGTDDYRLGDEWGKKPVKVEDLAKASPAFRRAATATARVGGGTSFYLGKFNGQHVMATNHHVMPESSNCTWSRVRFPLLNVVGACDKYLGTWDEIDLTLFTVRLENPADEAKLAPAAANFQFREDIKQGERLMTIGFGVAGNPTGLLMANQDSDCYVFSKDAEYRLMADPDQFNPGTYRAWSFAIGCDVSHGDSGSAIVDRETGKVIGIIWTGRIPKSASAQSSRFLSEIFTSQSETIWQELSYAVPARKMAEVLTRATEGSMPEETRALIRAVLGN